MLKSYKTPLRYPGGKSRATRFLSRHIPSNFKEYVEPFLGGGSMAIHISKENPKMPVWVNDKYFNLYAFWIMLQTHGDELQQKIIEKKDIASCFLDQEQSHRELFLQCKEEIQTEKDPFEVAWRFFVLNKCSFSGLGESSGFSKQASQSNFSYNNIKKLEGYSRIIKNWDITNLDYTEVLPACKQESFVFLDPPYDINSFLYGKSGNMHNNFDHDEFRDAASLCEGQTMITYNANDKLKEMFSSWNQLEWDLTYTLHSSKIYRKDESNRRELLLTNYGYPEEKTLEEFYEKNPHATSTDESPKRDMELSK